MVVDGVHEAAWRRNLASHSHGQGRQNSQRTLHFIENLKWVFVEEHQEYSKRMGRSKAIRQQVALVEAGGVRGSDDVGKWKFPERSSHSHKCHSHTVSSHKCYYSLNEFTITTPLLTRILNRLNGRGIILCGDVV